MLMKKVGGLGLVLLGGLTAAHGGSTGRAWETSVGLFLIFVGILLLFRKIARRNYPSP
jgi:hypothetical protein